MKSTIDKNTLWQQRVNAWLASGLQQAAWCRQNDVKAAQFWYWKNKLSGASTPVVQTEDVDVEKGAVAEASAFVPVLMKPKVPERVPPSCLTVALPSGLSISGIDTSNIVLAGRLIEVLV